MLKQLQRVNKKVTKGFIMCVMNFDTIINFKNKVSYFN